MSATLSASVGAIFAMIIVWCTGDSQRRCGLERGSGMATTLWRRRGPGHRPQVQFTAHARGGQGRATRPPRGGGTPPERRGRLLLGERAPPPGGAVTPRPQGVGPPNVRGSTALPGYELAGGSCVARETGVAGGT